MSPEFQLTPQLLDALGESTKDLSVYPPRLLGMIYGASGHGKTVLAVQIAQKITKPGDRIFYIDTADGWVSCQEHPGLLERLTGVAYKGISQLDTLIEAIKLTQNPESKSVPALERYQNIGTVILDEASTMAAFDLDTVTAARADVNVMFDEDKPEWDDRNIATNRFRKAIYRLINNTPCNIILVAHDREAKNKKKITVTSPAFAEKTSELVRQPLHLVGYLTADNQVTGDNKPVYRRSVQCWPTNQADAKSRISSLNVNETPEALVEKISAWLSRGGVVGDEAPKVNVESNDTEFQGIEVE